jgi:hypothetical protein
VQWVIAAAENSNAVVGTEPGARAAGFYKRMGFVTVGKLSLDDSRSPGVALEIPVSRYLKQGLGRAELKT